MNYAKIVKQSLIILITIVLVAIGLNWFQQRFQTTAESIIRESGYSNTQGRATFTDKSTKDTIVVVIADAETKEPLPNIQVEYVNNGQRQIIVAYDITEKYASAIYEAPLNKPHALVPIGASVAYAQGPAEVINFFLDLKSHIQSIEALELLIKHSPTFENWNLIYHEECWTHEQLKAGVQLEFEGIRFAFPVGASGGIFAEQTQELWAVAQLISAEASESNVDLALSKLPEPVKLKVYHLPTTIPGVTIQALGACQKSEVTPPVNGGFATRIAGNFATMESAEIITPETSSAMPQEQGSILGKWKCDLVTDGLDETNVETFEFFSDGTFEEILSTGEHTLPKHYTQNAQELNLEVNNLDEEILWFRDVQIENISNEKLEARITVRATGGPEPYVSPLGTTMKCTRVTASTSPKSDNQNLFGTWTGTIEFINPETNEKTQEDVTYVFSGNGVLQFSSLINLPIQKYEIVYDGRALLITYGNRGQTTPFYPYSAGTYILSEDTLTIDWFYYQPISRVGPTENHAYANLKRVK